MLGKVHQTTNKHITEFYQNWQTDTPNPEPPDPAARRRSAQNDAGYTQIKEFLNRHAQEGGSPPSTQHMSLRRHSNQTISRNRLSLKNQQKEINI